MKYRAFITFAIVASLQCGCRSTATPANDQTEAGIEARAKSAATQPVDAVVARVNGIDILRADLERPLIEAYGMNMLLNLVQLNLARDQARRLNVTVGPEDIRKEHDQMLASMFSEAAATEYDQLLQQYLQQQHVTRVDFDLIVESNAYLRKLAEPQMAGQITDDMVRQAFGQLYGEKREVSDIELANLRQVGEAQRRLKAGEAFDKVAAAMSNDHLSAGLGGRLPPFSSNTPNIPQAIRQTAFTLKIGEIADPISTGETFHLIKLEQIIAPRIVKFEDVKDSVRTTLEKQWLQLAMGQLRNQLGQIAVRSLVVNDPVLAAQWRQKLDEAQRKAVSREDIRNEMAAHPQPTSAPATQPEK